MRRDELNDLAAFEVVAREGSFTRAAATLGMSQSALSHAMRGLEDRLKVRLLSRTTRSVSTTEAGEILLRSLRPALEDIASGLAEVGALGAAASGPLRITATKNAVTAIILPVLPAFLASHPNVSVELIVDDNLTDIVANRFDAGIRFGNIIEKDMIAVRIGPDMQRAVVGSPDYFAKNPPPATPHDLAAHDCITYRLVRTGGFYAWEFEEDGQPLHVRVSGSLVFNDSDLMRASAIAGMGIAYVYDDDAAADIQEGRLIRVLEDYCPHLPGYYLYHPSRRQTPPALTALISALRSGSQLF
ncbi:DNA-binding transcriptional LysR family regulator [Novosphingobium sp. PhB57]|uniref:LysR family transcriptional regulator n=1 Tax=Novosphingobium sp. PhB57 TaxID=2485107 RepID=UPI00104C5D56|nr:LysR family transcriptional regulator [Novosphingobium sp. PhB57]TCU54690.1 DNA-binding transcriptional LysR family regulator [Novosphingobium sp. PhB57]